MLAGPGPYNRGASDNRDFTFRCVRASQLLTQFTNDGRFRFIGVDDRVDELKQVSARRRALHRNHANALMTDHNLVTFTDVEKLDCPGSAFFSVNCNCAVHHGRLNFDLFAIASNERLLVGCHVEIARKNAVRRGLGQLRILAFGNLRPVLSQAQDQLVERFACFGRDFDSREALIRPFFADLDLANLKIRAAGQDLIQHLWQNERVNDVSAQLDRFRKHPQNLAEESGRASESSKTVNALMLLLVLLLLP